MKGLLLICLISTGTSIYLIVKAITTRKLLKMLTGTILFAIAMTFGHALALDIHYTANETALSTKAATNKTGPSSSYMSYVAYEYK